eukprot:7033897-Ditylum_brightwellii.AAC.1
MEAGLYGTLSGGTAYTAPLEPVRGPLLARTSLADREDHEQLYRADKQEYNNHNTMEEALKNQVQEAVDDIYLQQLKNRYTGYMGVATRDILDHLLDQY